MLCVTVFQNLYDRYAHLAAEQSLTAVETVDRKDLLLLVLKLQFIRAVCVSIVVLVGVDPD